MKYAFQNKSNGTIKISLKVLGKDKLLLAVKDDGIGFSNHKERRSFSSLGLQLVELFVQQLKGNISFNSKSGTEVEIIFPKPEFIQTAEE